MLGLRACVGDHDRVADGACRGIWFPESFPKVLSRRINSSLIEGRKLDIAQIGRRLFYVTLYMYIMCHATDSVLRCNIMLINGRASWTQTGTWTHFICAMLMTRGSV